MSFLASDMEIISGAISSYSDFINDYVDLLFNEIRSEIGDDELSRLLSSLYAATLKNN